MNDVQLCGQWLWCSSRRTEMKSIHVRLDTDTASLVRINNRRPSVTLRRGAHMNVLDPPCPFGPAATVLRHDLGDFAPTVIGLVRWAFEAGRGMVRRKVLTADHQTRPTLTTP
jgi:hypothetical protein